MAKSKSALHDRRGFEFFLKFHLFLAALSIGMLFYNWRIGLALLLYSCIVFITLEVVSAEPINSPKNFTLWIRHRGSIRKPVLLCLGDSLTHGTISANITPDIPFKLSEKLGLPPPTGSAIFFDPVWVVNAGQNSITSHTLLTERLHYSLNCYPDFVYVMIGTNDVLAMYSPTIAKQLVSINQLPAVPTMAAYEKNMTKILDHLYQSSPLSQVAVATLPPMGEDLNHPANQLIRQANDIIEKVVNNASGKVTLVPVYDRFETILEKQRRTGTVNLFVLRGMFMAPLYHFLSLSWNTLGGIFSNTLLTDGLHLNERGRDEVVEAIIDWLMFKANVAKAIAVKS